MKQQKFTRTVINACSGFTKALVTERNLQWQIILMLLVITAGFLLKISIQEWYAIIIFCGLVISFELMNSSIERLCDRINKNFDIEIKHIKDISAASVLFVSAISLITGLIIFIPKLIKLYATF